MEAVINGTCKTAFHRINSRPKTYRSIPPLGLRWTKCAIFFSILDAYRHRWRIQGVPSLKRVVRPNRDEGFLNGCQLATVFNRFGAVPAPVIGQPALIK